VSAELAILVGVGFFIAVFLLAHGAFRKPKHRAYHTPRRRSRSGD
jgi:hypothetical protein